MMGDKGARYGNEKEMNKIKTFGSVERAIVKRALINFSFFLWKTRNKIFSLLSRRIRNENRR